MSVTPEIAQPTPTPDVQAPVEAPVEAPAPIETPSQATPQAPQVVATAPVQPQPQPANQTVSDTPTVTIPTSQTALTQMAQGNPGDSMTWLAHFWERVVKKALKKGWHVVFGTDPAPVPTATETQNQVTQPPQTVQ